MNDINWIEVCFHPKIAEALHSRIFDVNPVKEKFKVAKNQAMDDLDEVEPDDNDIEETPVVRKAGRPKGSGNSGAKTTAFHGITLTKRGIPKRIIVTHVMGKNVRAVSAKNQNMDPITLTISSVRHFDEDTFEQLEARGEKINAAVDQNFGLFNQLKALNSPKRGASLKNVDPAEAL